MNIEKLIKNQYNTSEKAINYDDWTNESIHMEHLAKASLLKLIGNLKDKTLIDYACGSGYHTQIFAQKAQKVVGIDISELMIQVAKKRPSLSNTEFHVRNCEEILNLGEYDVVSAVYLLNYAKTKEMLKNFLTSMYNSLKPKGICCGITHNSFMTADEFHYHLKYDMRFGAPDPTFNENNDITLDFLDHKTKESVLQIRFYYLEPSVIEETFKEVGFVNFKWIHFTLNEEQNKYKEFLIDYLNHPESILYYAEKP